MLSELWIQPPIISQGRLNHIRKKKEIEKYLGKNPTQSYHKEIETK